jgi:hypothetical protein
MRLLSPEGAPARILDRGPTKRTCGPRAPVPRRAAPGQPLCHPAVVPDALDAILPVVEDPISAVFRHFEKLTTLATGRTVGRKIGVAQEVLLKKYLEADERLRRRMYLERHLDGASGAAHKVEFSWYSIASHALEAGDAIPGLDDLRILSVDDAAERIRIEGPWQGRAARLAVDGLCPRKGVLRERLGQKLDLRVVAVDGGRVELDIVDFTILLGSLESKRVGVQRFSGSDKLGTGIQTIEKAKQASLVAIDLDLRHNGTIKPLATASDARRLISLVAVGNGVNWTPKDKAVLGTYVDFTYLVRDAAIIRYAKFVHERDEQELDELAAFMAYFVGLTKQSDDDFEVLDDDFELIAPDGETRSLRAALVDHIAAVDA